MAKRSLHVGINDYPGTGLDLSGCVNDANDWRAEMEKRGFSATSLLDGQATKAAMLEAFEKITKDSGRDDLTVITFSGHGTWVPDVDGDELDGRDEALCPHDITSGQTLADDELYNIFGQRKRGARIIFISDSCHSGSVSRMGRALHTLKSEPVDPWKFQQIRFMPLDFHIKDVDILKIAKQGETLRGRRMIKAATVLFSGCADHEYSYDAWFQSRANGAFTYVALAVLKSLPEGATYRDWYKAIRQYLPHYYYPQTPQLNASYAQKAKWKVLEE
jgi:metacaspase-1